MTAQPPLIARSDDTPRRRIRFEILIVLALSLGANAIYSLVGIVNRLTLPDSLPQQTATIHRTLSPRPTFDLIYQMLGILFDVMPVALVIFLLWQSARPRLGALGIDFTKPVRDTGGGFALAAIIGIPAIAFYLIGRSIGITVTVVPTALDVHWWTVPVLLLSALRAGIVEEVIVIGYLFARLRALGWSTWMIIGVTALLRGTYHLYQGIGPFIGNIVMGVLFGWLYSKYGRLLPLVIAHVIIDVVVFIGYPWAAAAFPELFGLPS